MVTNRSRACPDKGKNWKRLNIVCVRFSVCKHYSSIAQLVERMTVNHDVVGSSPTWGVD